MPYTDIKSLEQKLVGMSEAEQYKFLLRLSMETHVRLELHLQEEAVSMQKLDEVHQALFHPQDGLVHIRSWLCRFARMSAWIAGGTLSGLAAVATIGHQFGLW